MNDHILFEIRNMNKSFGPTKALSDVSMKLYSGEIMGLMGENGSGKSTVSSIIAGIQRADSGEMFFNGKKYAPKSVLAGIQEGICMIVQEQGTFADTTVAENIYIGKENKFIRHGVLNVGAMRKAAKALLDSLRMEHIDPAALCSAFSFEDKKLIEIARAMESDPQILIVDETTSALSKRRREILYFLMEKMRREGKAVIFISHDIDELMEKCDSLTVLRDGVYIDRLEKAQFESDLIKQLMVGREMLGDYYRADNTATREKEIALEVCSVSNAAVSDISFTVYKGEILGIGGLNDCGMHELGKTLFGLQKIDRGRIVRGNGVPYRNPGAAMKLGVGYMSKDRDKEAIMTAGSIRDNICLPSFKKISKTGLIFPKAEKEFSQKYSDILRVKMQNVDELCMHLSGGNKQKVVAAKWLGFDADVLIMDCPTRGIDIGVKAEMYRLMEDMKARKKTIILISEELMELLGMSDRILVMKDGRIQKEFYRDQCLTDKELINYMI